MERQSGKRKSREHKKSILKGLKGIWKLCEETDGYSGMFLYSRSAIYRLKRGYTRDGATRKAERTLYKNDRESLEET